MSTCLFSAAFSLLWGRTLGYLELHVQLPVFFFHSLERIFVRALALRNLCERVTHLMKSLHERYSQPLRNLQTSAQARAL